MNSHSRHLRTPSRRTRWLAFAAAASVALGAAPAASADTLTVDDDKAQCPSADFTTLQAAVASAPQGSTIVVCAGTYNVPAGTPANPDTGAAADPKSQGLRIDRNLTLKGEGADKVFVQPTNTFPTIASPTPNERDDYGNVITVKRRAVELSSVSISGMTIQGNGVAVEAGIAMIDVNSSSITGVRVRNLTPTTGPGTGAYASGAMAGQGDGIVVANTIEKTVNSATVTGNDISGYNKTGILVDGRKLAGDAPIGSTLTATVNSNKVTGAGNGRAIGQNGIVVFGGPVATIRGNAITANGSVTTNEDATTTAGVLLRGPGTGTIVGTSGSTTSASSVAPTANTNNITGNGYGLYNGTFAGDVNANAALPAEVNWWGAASGPMPTGTGDRVSGQTSVDYTPWANAVGTVTAAAAAPAAPTNAAPTVSLDSPTNGSSADGGVAVPLGAVAGDDFGVAKVDFKVDGTVVATDTTYPYTGTYTTPTVTANTNQVVTAEVTDSGGKTTPSAPATITVRAPRPAGTGTGTGTGGSATTPSGEGDTGSGTTGSGTGSGGSGTTTGGGGAATTPSAQAPVLANARIAKARPRRGRARLVVKLSEAGTATLKLTTTVKGKPVVVGRATVKFTKAGRKVVYVKLSSYGKRLLARRKSVRVVATIKTKTAAGTSTVLKKVSLIG